MIGQTLSHFEITAKLGEGGMGEVYRATDTKLGREVAIKVLPEAFTSDPERFSRFEREARVLASLNHSNIAAIHDLAEDDGTHFLVLELAEGENLAERLDRGPIPIDQALSLALQIAKALEAAHEKGIIHRDLKPANVMVGPEGEVKVLDFGLAKAIEPAVAAERSASLSPTLTLGAMTEVGVILGTAAYMSPEQARGRPVDRRADIWAFGSVLYEMLTGRRAFEGDDVTEILASVVKDDPDWGTLPSLPEPLPMFLRQSLKKDPSARLGDVREFRLALEGAFELPAMRRDRRSAARGWPIAFAIAAVAALALTGTILLRRPPPREAAVLDLQPPKGFLFDIFEAPPRASPDGSEIAGALVDRSLGFERLAVRSLNSTEYRILPIETPMWDHFWSPDSRYLGFHAYELGKLMRIDVHGGPPLEVADVPSMWGASWGADHVIVFAPDPAGPLYKVDASGGEPEPVTVLARERAESAHWRPHFLPDGRRFLYLAALDPTDAEADAEAYVAASRGSRRPRAAFSLRIGSVNGEAAMVLDGTFESTVMYSPPGYLLYERSNTLFARPFDLATMSWAGEQRIVAQDVDSGREYAMPAFHVSPRGILTYHRRMGPPGQSRLVWRGRSGDLLSEVTVPGVPSNLDLAPDGRRAAMERSDDARNRDIWITDMERGTHQRLTFGEARERGPVWGPRGFEIVYLREGAAENAVLLRATSGLGDETELFESPLWPEVVDWSADGRYLLLEMWDASNDLWIWSTEGGDLEPFVATPFDEHSGRFSPNGEWIAYQSNESGRPEIYVQAWPRRSTRWQVSTGGGTAPRWRNDGREIYYGESRGPHSRLMAAPVEIGSDGTFRSGTPEPLFDIARMDYEPSPDGQRFLVIEPLERLDPPPATVVLDWLALLDDDS